MEFEGTLRECQRDVGSEYVNNGNHAKGSVCA
ncbi:protein of unknown function [Paraburkholderia kururiensis]